MTTGLQIAGNMAVEGRLQNAPLICTLMAAGKQSGYQTNSFAEVQRP